MLVNFTKSALDASIFRVDTVVNSKWISWTVNQSCLSSNALDIIQENRTSSLAIKGKPDWYSTYT